MNRDTITVTPIAPALGAEVGGVDLAAPLDDAAFAEIERALVDHLVLFFRGRVLTSEQQRRFSAQFGANGRSGQHYQANRMGKPQRGES